MPLQLDDLAALDAPTLHTSGLPLMLPVEDIDEDPDQPRHEFDADALQELAETIRERGVRQPISVRPNLQHAGRWVLNFGSRRLRASKLVGLDEIPTFIDTTADSYDQVIENEQREGLRPLELSLFVQKRLAAGDSQSDIAKRLGKSRQYVTLATALIDAPDWLVDLYRQGRCTGMAELYELRRMHSEHPKTIEVWCSEHETVTRSAIVALRTELSGEASGPAHAEPAAGQKVLRAAPLRRASETETSVQKPNAKLDRPRNVHLLVKMDGEDYQLVVSAVPQVEGHLYVRALSGGPNRQVPAARLQLVGFVSR